MLNLLYVNLFSVCSFTGNASLSPALEGIDFYTQKQKLNKQLPTFPKIVQKITKTKIMHRGSFIQGEDEA